MAISLNNFSFATFLSADFGDSAGSGFRIRCNQRDFIITAKHVLFNKEAMLSDLWIKSRNYNGSDDDAYSAKIDLRPESVITIENLDIAIVQLEEQFNYIIETPGVDISIATIEDTLLFNDINIGSNIFLVGFPSSLTVDNFYDVDRPLLRTGIIAGKNINNDTFIIESLAYYGVSGGPVVQIDNERNIKVVGVVVRFVPFITEWKNKHEISLSRQDFYNSGYAVCIPLNKIIEKINAVQ